MSERRVAVLPHASPAVPPADQAESTAHPEPGAAPEAPAVDKAPTLTPSSGDTSTNQVADAPLRTSGMSSADATDVAFWIGRRLAQYEITKLLGTGGMGVVYQAHDTLIDRDVAVKMLLDSLSSDEKILKRFLIEARAAGKLNHPHAVAIYEIGQEGPRHYLVMELVSGGCVGTIVEGQGAYPPLEATRIVAEACRGLGAAHRVGLVHRDVKPGNLLLAADGTVKVSDFGLAKTCLTTGEQVTQLGQVIGTPFYMSPEQCQGQSVDHRSDLYSLGATYYSLLCGRHPFSAAHSIVQVMFGHCKGERPDPRKINKLVPDACAAIIARAMAIRPENRYQSAEEMLADLNAVRAALSAAGTVPPDVVQAALAREESTSSSRRKFLLAGAGFATAVLGSAGAGLIWHSRNTRRNQGDAPSGQNVPAASAGPTGAPLRVGILHSLSGTLATSESPVVDATLLAIDQINAAGGVLGRPIEPVVRDGQSEALAFAAAARQLIYDEKVCTVFGCWSSASRKTVVPLFEDTGHLLVYPVQYEGLEQSPNVIYLGAAPTQQIIPAVKWAFAFNDCRKFFLVGSDYVFPRTAAAIIKDTLAELGGTVVGEEYIPLGETETKALVEKIAAAAPDTILNTINGDSNIAFFKELRRAGITPENVPTISFSIGEVELRSLNLSQMAGDFAAWNYFQSLANSENAAFVETFQARHGVQRVISDPMETAYVGVKLWAAAVNEAQSDRPDEIRRAMLNQRLEAPEGEVRIDAATQHAFKTPRIGKILNDGQFEVVWTATRPELPQPFPPSRTGEQWKAFLDDLYHGWGNRWEAPDQ
jgi:urea transport system substrate-binding protein